ncbi:hypothetical protein GN244_ATG15336 [Phytophthora infestans]|uniref:Uncharacterized protein n=1 Tax=Phytophthora infestans TaxID=4787 RepID=A0A833SFP1_PHYIN|nr:hypothetical protein GN244_ATG15336 [Phytophthora infestans]
MGVVSFFHGTSGLSTIARHGGEQGVCQHLVQANASAWVNLQHLFQQCDGSPWDSIRLTPHLNDNTNAMAFDSTEDLFDGGANDTSGEPVNMMNHIMPSDHTSARAGLYRSPATTSGAM